MNLTLIEPVQAILKKVEEVTNKGFEFIVKDAITKHASVKIARKNMPKHIIYYSGTHSDIINHLVAHECGHILRMFRAPENKRLMPQSTEKEKSYAFSELEEDLNRLSEKLGSVVGNKWEELWFESLITQLTSFPPDLMIEKWLYSEYPELRTYQLESLKKQHKEAIAGLSVEVKKFTPTKIYNSSNLMNYVFFRLVGLLLNINFAKAYNDTDFIFKGKKLAALTEENYVNNYEGDIDMINRWANFLELTNWFTWTDFENVPKDYIQSY